MKPQWDTPVMIPGTGEVITNSQAAFAYVQRRWDTFPQKERCASFRRLMAAQHGRCRHAEARSAFIALLRAGGSHP